MTLQTSRPAADWAVEVPAWHALPGLEAAKTLHVDPPAGLTGEDAARRLAEAGPNRIAPGEPEPRRQAFLRRYRDPAQVVLVAAGVGSLLLGELPTALVVLAVTVCNAVLALRQQGSAPAAAAALQRTLARRARARRDGALCRLPAERLVPGDVVRVEAGDTVPADGRLLASARLEVDESALTGESLPAAKGIGLVADPQAPLGDRVDMLYMGTIVSAGAGELVVTATGMSTEVGRIAQLLQASGAPEPPLTRRIGRLTSRMITLAGAALAGVVAFGLAHGHGLETVLASMVAFAVAAVPAGLPVAVTAILAHGARRLADAGATVGRLRSAASLGATSAVNVGRAGTLTLGQLTAVELTAAGRRYTVSGSGYADEGAIRHVAGAPEASLEPCLLPMALATDARLCRGELTGDPIEGALVVLAEKGGLDVAATRERHPRIAELPFDSTHKLRATFHAMTDESGRQVVRCLVNGAPDQLLARCRWDLGPDMRVRRADDAARRRWLEESARLARRRLRVVATARCDHRPTDFDSRAGLLPLVDGLTLLALVGLEDPPRAEARASIAAARAARAQVRLVTGDRAPVAESLARRLGIAGRAITGAELAAMTDAQAARELEGIGVVARAAPEHRAQLVRLLQRSGRVVAALGGGASDAPALAAADVGIALRDGGSEVSREAAAMLVSDDRLSTIVRALEFGRGLSDGLVRCARFQLAALTGAILTFLGASLLNVAGGMPFLPLQTLYVNFTSQVSQSVGLGCATSGRRPHPGPVDDPIVPPGGRLLLGAVALLQAGATLAVLAIAEHRHGTPTARTMGLVTLALANLMLSCTLRDGTRSVFSLETFADRAFLVATAASVAAIVAGAETHLLSRMIETTSLSLGQWLLCLAAASLVVPVSEAHKLLARRRATA